MAAKRKSNILIVDDSAMVREYIIESLMQSNDSEWNFFDAGNGRAALELMRRKRIDLILCDVMMPEMDGFTFLETVTDMPAFADIPIIMLTAVDAVEKKVLGLNAGASDYLVKPFDEAELTARVRVQLKVKYLQDELKKANKRYKKLSITDYLTGAFNRRHFMQILKKEFDRARRYDQPLSLIILDIDHFKGFNDEYGHQQGDRILVELSKLIAKSLRNHDILARYGGEEFVILLPMVKDEIGMAAERLRSTIERHRFSGSGERKLTVSMGGCTYPSRGIHTIDDLIAKADNFLYRAKRAGRNRVVVQNLTGEKTSKSASKRELPTG